MQDMEWDNMDGEATPDWLFDVLSAQVESLTSHPFELDAAAAPWNAKCEYYYTRETDALTQDWTTWKTIFLNPPFDVPIIEKFAFKALETARSGTTIVLLVPNWPGYSWYQELKRQGHMQDVVGPVVFHRADGTTVTFSNGARKTNISIFTLGPKITPGTNGPPISSKGISDPAPVIHAGVNGASGNRRKHRLLSEITPKATEWLWPGRIPLGEISVLDGDPGTNKSSVLLDLTARISTGSMMPDGSPCEAGGVLLLLGEDSIPKTVVGRLKTAGANLDRIACLDAHTRFPRHCETLRSEVHRLAAKLVVIDPLMAFLEPDSNSDQKVRQALSPLADVAEETNAAIVLVRHLNKRGGKTSLYRGSGSIGIIGAARSGLFIGRSPDDPNFRVLCQVKSNLGPIAPTLLFEPVDADGVPRIEWRGECDLTADDLLAQSPKHGNRLTEAQSFLAKVLVNGPVEQRLILQRAIADGLAMRTVERAKEILGVISERRGWGPGSASHWRLPESRP